MSNAFLDTPIEYLSGVGPMKGELLRKELQIAKFGDLLWHLPYRYIDKTKVQRVADINEAEDDGKFFLFKGEIRQLETLGDNRKKRMVGTFRDESGSLELVWFQGVTWLEGKIPTFQKVYLYGRLSFFNHRPQISHPEIESTENEAQRSTLAPVYATTEKLSAKGLDPKGIRKIQKTLQEKLSPQHILETLPEYITQQLRLVPLLEALQLIHFPRTQAQAEAATKRLKFEELFFAQLRILQIKQRKDETQRGYFLKEVGALFLDFYENKLPFPFTEAQKRVIKEIRKDVGSGRQMNRLLQGDVGSGKTIVAFMTILLALGNGYQACLLAPTEILAQQHYQSLEVFCKALDINIGFLSGSIKGKARNAILTQLQDGHMRILTGTHALLEDPVIFKNLGLAIIDEQHRFGVEQRARLWKKSQPFPPHILVMTATPIPRTLAMTLYGDLEVSVIDELPPGRKPITTVQRNENHRNNVYAFLRDEIAKGRQAYIVYPVIEETENEDLATLYQGYAEISELFPMPDYQISVVHGKMKSADKDAEMARFVQHQTQIMVATTVIEVGVNVPNASVMIIENAQRFGLSQLHQLRGRVGRGAEQSFCILMHNSKLTHEGRLRIKTMCESNDGFHIAEVDLQLRGPGDLQGKQQSGVMRFRIANLAQDQAILSTARQVAKGILERDPKLQESVHRPLARHLDETKDQSSWGKIS